MPISIKVFIFKVFKNIKVIYTEGNQYILNSKNRLNSHLQQEAHIKWQLRM